MKPYGIPTEVLNHRFRSRLEARWAFFFTLCGWEWQYEPIERPGWIPDFTLKQHKWPEPILVEVKPIYEFDTNVSAKINAADHEHEVLLLGLGPEWRLPGHWRLGWLREDEELPYSSGSWNEAPLYVWNDKRIGFGHCEGWYGDRITGNHPEENIELDDTRKDALIRYLWGRAANAVQWKAR